ncbi:hypothetical protein EV363DRAFT_1344973 [Boletus edulis]|nr:hypothetical protein EV363DRAFT_1344973 [Boletus edulis]
MTSTGVFCFVPISQRLTENGIIPASESNRWRFQGLPCILAQTLYAHKEEKVQILLPADNIGNDCSEAEQGYHTQPPDGAFVTDQELVMPCADSDGSASPIECCPGHSPLQSTPVDTFYGHESTSFISDSTLCDNCDTLLRREIPPDHIPSVIRALALFEAQDRLADVVFNEYDVVALTNAFSMLRL